MTQIPSIGGLSLPAEDGRRQTDAINNVNLDDFLNLMITELQNQDPLNPLDNTQMLQQISQIREVGATDRLTNTLDTLLLRQNVASATALIGQQVQGNTVGGGTARGLVDRVSIVDGVPQLHVEGKTRAAPAAVDGKIEAGTYRYRVVFEKVDDQGRQIRYGMDLGPVETTGTPERDRAIALSNLPATAGPKMIYRTDASGGGDYRLAARVEDGQQTSFVDTFGDDELADRVVFTGQTTAYAGSQRFLLELDKLTQIQLPDPD